MIRKILLTTMVISIALNAYAYENGDFQIWHTEGQDVKVYKDIKATMEEEFRFGENASEFYYQHYDWGVVYGFDKRLDIGFNYRQVYEKYKHKWREENRPHVNATLKLDLWRFKFEDRNRLEFRYFRYRNDFIRYRNKFTLKFPFDFKKMKVSPYVSDEIFISSDATGFNENRLYSGIELGLTKYVKFDTYYLFKCNRTTGAKWNNTNVLGLKLKIAF